MSCRFANRSISPRVNSWPGRARDEFRVILQIPQPRKPAGAGSRVAVAEYDIRQRFVRQRVQQSRVVARNENANPALFGNRRQTPQKVLRTAGMHAVVDLLDNQDAVFGHGERPGRNGKNP